MKKESTKRPNLRFPGFSESWEKTTLGELLTFKNGLNAGKEDYGDGEKFINVLDIIQNNFIIHDKIIGSVKASEKNKELYKVEFGDVLFQRSSETREEVGQANVYLDREKPALFGGFVIRGKKKSDYDPIFINHLLKTPLSRQEITSKSGGSTRYNVGQETLSSVEITIASLPEQQKIASFLSSVDERIELLERKKEKLEAYKKGVMQQIFSQQIRFKQEDGSAFPDWEEKRLGEVLKETKLKNKGNKYSEVFSVAKQKGVVNQIEHLGRSYAAESIEHYKIANPYDIIYTKSPTSDFPFGIIKQNLTGRSGVLSPLYGVFKPKTPELGTILHNYFSSWIKTYNYLVPIVQKGAKNTMNINNDDFLNGAKMKLPMEREEQKKIAGFLNSIDENLETLDSQIRGLRTWKKGLLQQMFV